MRYSIEKLILILLCTLCGRFYMLYEEPSGVSLLGLWDGFSSSIRLLMEHGQQPLVELVVSVDGSSAARMNEWVPGTKALDFGFPVDLSSLLLTSERLRSLASSWGWPIAAGLPLWGRSLQLRLSPSWWLWCLYDIPSSFNEKALWKNIWWMMGILRMAWSFGDIYVGIAGTSWAAICPVQPHQCCCMSGLPVWETCSIPAFEFSSSIAFCQLFSSLVRYVWICQIS
jgi:hypothetical protein